MNHPDWTFDCVVLTALVNGLSSCNMVAVGEVWKMVSRAKYIKLLNRELTKDDIGVLDFFLDDIRVVQITVNNPDARVLGLDLFCLVLAADQSR